MIDTGDGLPIDRSFGDKDLLCALDRPGGTTKTICWRFERSISRTGWHLNDQLGRVCIITSYSQGWYTNLYVYTLRGFHCITECTTSALSHATTTCTNELYMLWYIGDTVVFWLTHWTHLFLSKRYRIMLSDVVAGFRKFILPINEIGD